MTDTLRDRAVQIYDAFTHEHHDRRRLLRQMTLLAGSAAAAEALILGIAASPAAAAISDPKDKRLKTSKGKYSIGQGRSLIGYYAAPKKRVIPLGSVMVIHENRGLTPHIEDVTRRIALAGFIALAPDFLTAQGGTPVDQDAARDLIGKIDYDAAIANGVGTIQRLARSSRSTGKVGAVGFCWGGAFVDRVALAAGPLLSGGVSYYGPAPAPAEAARLQVPLVLQLAGKDARVNGTALPFAQAAQAAGKSVVAYTYDGVDHAFNNDTSVERYDQAAAELAWGRTIAFLTRVVS